MDLVLRAEIRRQERDIRLRRTIAFETANLIALAINAPKRMPKARDYLRGGDDRPGGLDEMRAAMKEIAAADAKRRKG